MKSPNDLWAELGDLPDEELIHMLTKLFAVYETKLQKYPDDGEALNFFINLDNAISQTSQCNLNRR